MKVSTNVNPGKKKSKVSKVEETFSKAEEQAAKKYSKDSQSAKKYDEGLKKTAKGFQVKTGRVTSGDLAASGSYVGTKSKNFSEQERVKGLKQTGYYDAKPAVVGGTKRMVKRSKKNVGKSSASKQAKSSARKLY